MQSIIDVIESFDRATRQVMISATIAAVTLTDDLSLGLRWGASVNASTTIDNSIGFNGALTGTIDNILGGLFDNSGAVFTLGTASVGIALDALNQLTNVRIIQQPRTFTSDNQESIFFNGSEIPVQTDTTTTGTGVVQGGFEYRDVGIMLNVRPRITANGDIDLTINVELSDLVSNAGIGGNPIFSRRQVRSQVQLHDGQTVLIGGILKDREQKVKKKFPLLGDIPLIGALFTSVKNQTIREELLIFITPVIVNSSEDNNDNYNVDYLERLKEITLPVDEQVEHIKEGDDFLQNRLSDPGADFKKSQ
jgi:general secretion pathway protein D